MKTNAILFLLSTLIGLGLCEIGLRLFFPQQSYSQLSSLVGSYYAPSSHNTFTLKRNYQGTEPYIDNPKEKVHIQINADGFRGPQLDPEKQKILLIGDSYTFGVYIDDHDIFSTKLQELLAAQYPSYQVVNAGYTGGFETDQQYSWLVQEGLKHKPRLVILNIFLGNDITGIAPEFWNQKDSDELPIEYQNTTLYVDALGRLRSRVRDLRTVGGNPAYQYPYLRESHLAVLIGKVIEDIQIAHKVERMLKHVEPQSTGLSLEENFAHIFGVYSEEFLEKEALFHRLILGMKRRVEASGGTFAVALIPIDFMVQREKMDILMPNSKYRHSKAVYYERLGIFLHSNHIDYVDIGEAMNRQSQKDFFARSGDVHFNPNGHRFTAETLLSFLRDTKLITPSEHSVH